MHGRAPSACEPRAETCAKIHTVHPLGLLQCKRAINHALARSAGVDTRSRGPCCGEFDVPGQQRLIVVDGLRERQPLEQRDEVAVRLDVVGLGRVDERVSGRYPKEE